MRFLGFSNHEKGAPMQEILKWSTVCSTFSRSGWSVVRSATLDKGGSSKKGLSPHLQKFPTRNNRVSPRTLQTALVIKFPQLSRLYFWCQFVYHFLRYVRNMSFWNRPSLHVYLRSVQTDLSYCVLCVGLTMCSLMEAKYLHYQDT
jgi:hypothetical protein